MSFSRQEHQERKSSSLDDWLQDLSTRSPPAIIVLAVLGVVLMGALDFNTGYEISFSVFYLAPVALAAWYGSHRVGMAIAILSATVWLGVDHLSGHLYSHVAIAVWNGVVRLGFFTITAHLVALLRTRLHAEQELARLDAMTGLLNGRAFRKALQHSIGLARRSSSALSLAYVDVDHFKAVNDAKGHGEGDRLLRAIGQVFHEALRTTDYAGRLGGDEFGIVLPATNAEGAAALIDKLRRQLADRMRESAWPVGFSIGVISVGAGRVTVDEALKQADDLMYEVKHSGKNAARYRVL